MNTPITGNAKIDLIILLGVWLATKLGFRNADKKVAEARDWIRAKVKAGYRLYKSLPTEDAMVTAVVRYVRDLAEQRDVHIPEALWDYVENYAQEYVDEQLAHIVEDVTKPKKPPGRPPSVITPI